MKIQFTDPRTPKTVTLPSFPGSELVIYTQLTVGQQEEIRTRFPNAVTQPGSVDGSKSLIALIQKAIKSWNFTDQNDNDLEITEDIIRQFPEPDVKFLIEEITGKKIGDEAEAEDSKKKS